MQRPLLFTVVLAALILGFFGVDAARPSTPINLNTRDTTPPGLLLNFTLQRATWANGALLLWGTVTNKGTQTMTDVGVHFIAYDGTGQFLGRVRWQAEPAVLAPGAQGDLDACTIETIGGWPVTLEYQAQGTPVPGEENL